MFKPNWKKLFAAQKAERLVHDPTMGQPGVLYSGLITYPSWERTLPPDLGGAGLYAYEGIVLPQTSMLGAGHPYRPQTWTSRPYLASRTTLPANVGIAVGQIYTQPLYDPAPQGATG